LTVSLKVVRCSRRNATGINGLRKALHAIRSSSTGSIANEYPEVGVSTDFHDAEHQQKQKRDHQGEFDQCLP
jgi:hypothetical protein